MPADELNIVVDRFLERHDAAGFNLQPLSRRQCEFQMVAARVDESRAGPRELFENESLAADESRAQALRESDVQRDARLRAQETIALHQNRLPRGQRQRLNAPRIVAREAHFARA